MFAVVVLIVLALACLLPVRPGQATVANRAEQGRRAREWFPPLIPH